MLSIVVSSQNRELVDGVLLVLVRLVPGDFVAGLPEVEWKGRTEQPTRGRPVRLHV